MQTNVEIVAEAKGFLRQRPSPENGEPRRSPFHISPLLEWAKHGLGFDPYANRHRGETDSQLAEPPQLKAVMDKLSPEILEAHSIRRYMETVERGTRYRAFRQFFQLVLPKLKYDRPFFVEPQEGRSVFGPIQISETGPVVIRLDGSATERHVLPYDLSQFRQGNAIPPGIAWKLLLLRLMTHANTGDLGWFAADVADFQDEIPDYVLRKVRQICQRFKAAEINSLKLSFQVVFAAVDSGTLPCSPVELAPNKRIASRTIVDQFSVQGVNLPLRLVGIPILAREYSIDPETIVDEATRLEAAIRTLGDHRPSTAYDRLPFIEQLSAQTSFVPPSPPAPRCDPFLVASLSSGSEIARRVIEVWDERSLEWQPEQ